MPTLAEAVTTEDVLNFFSGFDEGLADSCWEWKRGRSTDGYGRVRAGGETQQANRVSFLVHNGFLPDDKVVRHKCDNPPCVNPAHLLLGTNLDNVRDREERGRTASGDRAGLRLHPERAARGDRHGSRTCPGRLPKGDAHYSRTNPEKLAHGDKNGSRTKPDCLKRGEGHGMAKLTEESVRAIREQYSAGETTLTRLATQYGVGKSMVGYIVNGHYWRHVT